VCTDAVEIGEHARVRAVGGRTELAQNSSSSAVRSMTRGGGTRSFCSTTWRGTPHSTCAMHVAMNMTTHHHHHHAQCVQRRQRSGACTLSEQSALQVTWREACGACASHACDACTLSEQSSPCFNMERGVCTCSVREVCALACEPWAPYTGARCSDRAHAPAAMRREQLACSISSREIHTLSSLAH
jgi:hypothetical protein